MPRSAKRLLISNFWYSLLRLGIKTETSIHQLNKSWLIRNINFLKKHLNCTVFLNYKNLNNWLFTAQHTLRTRWPSFQVTIFFNLALFFFFFFFNDKTCQASCLCWHLICLAKHTWGSFLGCDPTVEKHLRKMFIWTTHLSISILRGTCPGGQT